MIWLLPHPLPPHLPCPIHPVVCAEFTGPDGTLYTDSNAFGESWRATVVQSPLVPGEQPPWSWALSVSNFYPGDPIDPRFVGRAASRRLTMADPASLAVSAAQQKVVEVCAGTASTVSTVSTVALLGVLHAAIG